MQKIIPTPNPEDSRPPHPDTLTEPDRLTEALFNNMVRDNNWDTDLVTIDLEMSRELAKNDKPAPPKLDRNRTAGYYGLSMSPANTATFGPHGGMAFMDHEGDIGSAWLANLGNKPGIVFTVNGEQVFYPMKVWVDMVNRLGEALGGRPSAQATRWTIPDEYDPFAKPSN